jgi:hypothetical protein
MVLIPDELQRLDLRAAIIDAVQTAYDVNLERFDTAMGDDQVTFGIQAWKSTTYFLKQKLAAVDGVTVSVVNQSVEILVGRVRLRNHKLGTTEADDPYHSFPGHPGPAARMGRVEQLELGLGLDVIYPLDWVIGHYGSPDEGLRAIRFQAPGAERDVDGSIVSWRHVETIYDASLATAPTRRVSLLTGAAAKAVTIAEPDIAIRRQVQTDLGGAPA